MRSFAAKLSTALSLLPEWSALDRDIRLLVEASKGKKHVPTVAVDLDGTLTRGAKFKSADHIDPPRDGAREALEQFKEWGFRVIIFTVRGNTERVREWLEEHEIPFDFINENPDQPPDSSGKIIADVYIDDRAIRADEPWPVLARKVKKILSSKRRAA